MATQTNPITAIKNAVGNALKNIGNPVGQAASAANSAANNPAGKAVAGAASAGAKAVGLGGVGSAISSVEGFVSAFGNKTLWIRTAKVVAGGSLMLIGLAKITGVDKDVVRVASKTLPGAGLLMGKK